MQSNRSTRLGRSVRVCAFLAAAVAGVATASAATITATWLNPVSGNWNDGTKWSSSPSYPNNGSPGAGDAYEVMLDATGAAYTLSLNSNATVTGLTLNSAAATLDQTSGTLKILNSLDLQSGTYKLRGGTISGGTVTGSPGGTLQAASYGAGIDGITLATNLNVLTTVALQVTNGLNLAGGRITLTGVGSYNTAATFNGSQTISGTGEIVFDGNQWSTVEPNNGILTIAPGVTIRTGTGSGTVGNGSYASYGFVNNGLIWAQTPGQTIQLVANWQNNGTLRVSAGTLSLGGTFSIGTIGNLEHLGGDVAIAGTMSNPGTLQLDATTGSWTLHGGTIVGGKVQTSGTAHLLLPTYGILDGVTLQNEQPMIINGALVVHNGLTLSGDVLQLKYAGGQNIPSIAFGGTPLSGTGQVVFDDSSTTSVMRAATIGPNITVSTGAGSGEIDGCTNLGLIWVQTSGQSIELTNTSGNWKNQGILRVSAGSLNLGGNFRLSDLGVIERTGGNVKITGTFDNTGTVLQLDSTTGAWMLHGQLGANTKWGRIVGGTVQSSDGTQLIAEYGTDSLAGVTLASDLTIMDGASVYLESGLTLTDHSIHLAGISANTLVQCAESLAMAGNGEVVFDGSQPRNYVSPRNGAVLTIGHDISIRTGTGGGTVGDPFADSPLGRLVNEGTVSVVTAGQIIAMAGKWTNQGILRVSDGILRLGGAFSLADIGVLQRLGGNVEITGTMSNAGTTLALDDTSGSWKLAQGGRINGGTVTATGMSQLLVTGSSTLDGVSLAAPTRIQGSGLTILTSFVLPGTTITLESAPGAASTLTLSGVPMIAGSGQLIFDGTADTGIVKCSSGTMTLAPGITVRTGTAGGTVGASGTSLINQSLISAQTAGKSLTVTGTSVSNQGTLEAINGGILKVVGLTGSIGTVHMSDNSQLDLSGTYSNQEDRNIVTGQTLTLRGTWTNTAHVTVDNSTLNLAGSSTALGAISLTNSSLNIIGTFTTAQIKTIPYTNTVVSIGSGGTLNNTNDVVVMDSITGSWRLAGGAISGGTVSSIDSQQLLAVGGISTLSGIALATNLTIEPAATVNLTGTTALLGPRDFVIGAVGTLSNSSTIVPAIGHIGGGGTFRSTSGSATIVGPQDWQSGAKLDAVGGTVYLNSDAGSQTAANLAVSTSGSGILYLNSPQHVKSLSIATGSRTELWAGIRQPLATETFSITGTGKLNLGRGDLLIGAGDLSAIRSSIVSGYNNGAWNGAGIYSNTIVKGRHALAYASGDDAAIAWMNGSFDAESFDANSVLVKFTYVADANFDGSVDGSDVALWAQNFSGSLGWNPPNPRNWTQGDWNYDDSVDGSDVALWAQNFTGALGGGGLGDDVAGASLAGVAMLPRIDVAEVPEPASLLLLGLPAVALLARRRR